MRLWIVGKNCVCKAPGFFSGVQLVLRYALNHWHISGRMRLANRNCRRSRGTRASIGETESMKTWRAFSGLEWCNVLLGADHLLVAVLSDFCEPSTFQYVYQFLDIIFSWFIVEVQADWLQKTHRLMEMQERNLGLKNTACLKNGTFPTVSWWTWRDSICFGGMQILETAMWTENRWLYLLSHLIRFKIVIFHFGAMGVKFASKNKERAKNSESLWSTWVKGAWWVSLSFYMAGVEGWSFYSFTVMQSVLKIRDAIGFEIWVIFDPRNRLKQHFVNTLLCCILITVFGCTHIDTMHINIDRNTHTWHHYYIFLHANTDLTPQCWLRKWVSQLSQWLSKDTILKPMLSGYLLLKHHPGTSSTRCPVYRGLVSTFLRDPFMTVVMIGGSGSLAEQGASWTR